MNIVSPSILSCDFLNIEKELSFFEDTKNLWVHLDIMDGHFVPNLTFGMPIIKQISNRSNLPLDAHLMVSNPKFHIDEMKDYGLTNITFHYEATDDPLELTLHAKKSYKSVGISIKPATLVSTLDLELLKNINLILVMSVEPGFGGQSFIENTYNKIEELNNIRNENNLSFQIQIDGGVTNNNSNKLREYGADNLVAGSYIFKETQDNYIKTVETLRS
jgi:ribulose-phosphate 3-epimerase